MAAIMPRALPLVTRLSIRPEILLAPATKRFREQIRFRKLKTTVTF